MADPRYEGPGPPLCFCSVIPQASSSLQWPQMAVRHPGRVPAEGERRGERVRFQTLHSSPLLVPRWPLTRWHPQTGWYTRPTLLLPAPGAGKSEIEVPAGVGLCSGEGSVLGLQTATLLPCPHGVGRNRDIFSCSSKATVPSDEGPPL